jgi:hypothetical protein
MEASDLTAIMKSISNKKITVFYKSLSFYSKVLIEFKQKFTFASSHYNRILCNESSCIQIAKNVFISENAFHQMSVN